jgi:drug/metabolite transporter (DMT)-like permease
MGSPTTIPANFGGGVPAAKPKINPIFLIFGCTIFAAVAQVLLKFGALNPMPGIGEVGPIGFVNELLHNWILLGGYSLHACNAALLILALREGELSVLYPVYALSYIWVDLLSLYYFHEHMNVWKVAGIALIIGGVAVLGKASSK